MKLNKKEIDELIYKTFKEMDEKTGLNATILPFEFSNSTNRKGCFVSTRSYSNNSLNYKPSRFKFSNYLFDGRYDIDVIKEVIKHEYIHYYCCVKYPYKRVNHGIEFKNACIKYGVNPDTYFSYDVVENVENLDLEKKLVFII